MIGQDILDRAGDVSDIAGFTSLVVLAAVLGLPSLDTIGNTFLRKRGEIALIFAIAAAGRAFHYFDLTYLNQMQRIVQGVVTTLTACMAVVRVVWGKLHVRR